jgi:hypothetical protein
MGIQNAKLWSTRMLTVCTAYRSTRAILLCSLGYCSVRPSSWDLKREGMWILILHCSGSAVERCDHAVSWSPRFRLFYRGKLFEVSGREICGSHINLIKYNPIQSTYVKILHRWSDFLHLFILKVLACRVGLFIREHSVVEFTNWKSRADERAQAQELLHCMDTFKIEKWIIPTKI